MLSFIAMLACVLITLFTVGGFLALGAVVAFEYLTMLVLWLKHSLKDPHARKVSPA